MDMIRLLLALHPKPWREKYGREFAALLEDTRLAPAVVADVLRNAAKLHAQARAGLLLVAGAALASASFEALALRHRLTANILWAPTTPLRALALAGVVAPWAGLVARRVKARAHDRDPGAV